MLFGTVFQKKKLFKKMETNNMSHRMGKKILIIICVVIIIIGFAFFIIKKNEYEDKNKSLEYGTDTSKMEDMQYLFASNTYGYYFDIYSAKSKDKERNGVIEVENSTDDLYFMIENAGAEREIAIQIFIDYIQVPIIIEGKEYMTYYVEADEAFSEEFSFRFAKAIDENSNHKMMAALTICSDLKTALLDEERTTNEYSLAYDQLLLLHPEKNVPLDNNPYENPNTVYKDTWHGVMVNSDIKEFKRKIPEKEIKVKAGEEFVLQYQVGGFTENSEAIVVLSLDMKQVQVNHHNFLKFKLNKEEIASGVFRMTAPQKPGLYELTGWVIQNPFSEKTPINMPLDTAYRFTVNVEK